VSRVERNSRLGRAFEKAVRRKPLARRTRALWLTNQALRSVRIGRPGRLVKWGFRQLRARFPVSKTSDHPETTSRVGAGGCPYPIAAWVRFLFLRR